MSLCLHRAARQPLTDDIKADLGVVHVGRDGGVADRAGWVSIQRPGTLALARVKAYTTRKRKKVTSSGHLRSLYFVAYSLEFTVSAFSWPVGRDKTYVMGMEVTRVTRLKLSCRTEMAHDELSKPR